MNPLEALGQTSSRFGNFSHGLAPSRSQRSLSVQTRIPRERSPPCTSLACCHRSASPCLDLQVVSPSAEILNTPTNSPWGEHSKPHPHYRIELGGKRTDRLSEAGPYVSSDFDDERAALPPPPQSAAAPYPPPRRRSSWARVKASRLPLMPIG